MQRIGDGRSVVSVPMIARSSLWHRIVRSNKVCVSEIGNPSGKSQSRELENRNHHFVDGVLCTSKSSGLLKEKGSFYDYILIQPQKKPI